jgi:signal transduction histidine kinase/ligand-binding sensor domain-containing protein
MPARSFSCSLVFLRVLILALALPRPAAGQYRIDSWTTEHGLPQGSINAVLQTRDGFLWVTTWGGLARFDGTTFRAYTTTTNPEMRSTRLAGMREDNDGRLWIRSYDNELMSYTADGNDTFVTYTTAHGLPADAVTSFSLKEGRIVAVTDKGTVVWQGDRFVPYVPPPGAPVNGNGTTIISNSLTNAIWYRTADGLVHRYEPGKPTRTVTLPFVGGVYEDLEGRVWMRQNTELVAIYDNVERRFGAKDGLPPFNALAIVEDPDGTLWLMASGALVRYRKGRFSIYTTADGLPDRGLRTFYTDREGSHWVGTQAGLARMTERALTTYTSDDGLEADPVYPVLQDRAGAVWIGSWAGLTRYRDGVFEQVSEKLNLKELMLSLFEDHDGSIWAGSYGGGVRRIQNDRVTSYRFSPGAPRTTFTITRVRSGDLLFGGQDGSVSVYRDDRFSRLTQIEGYARGEVHTLHEDAQGTLWIGSDVLTKYEGGRATIVDDRAGFAGRRIRSIHEDRAGTLWIGTYDTGLFRYRDGRFTRYTTREGLPVNSAFEIVEDGQGRFWMSSNAGVYRVARDDLDAFAAGRIRSVKAVAYGRGDGMANQECSGIGHPGVIRASDGRLWIGTQKGVSVIDPATLRVDLTPPAVSILELIVGGQPVKARDRIEIRSGATSVEAHYAALTFVRPELARYKYRMEGLDPDWVDAGSDRNARYAQLPYGTFQFRVAAANRDGVWNDNGASVTIVVVRPFYRTSWFTALVIVALAATGFGVHRWRLGLLRAQQEQQEAFSRQLIDSQEIDRRRIASGLHDGLSQSLIVIRNWALLGERALPADHATKTRLTEIAKTASDALGEVRTVVEDLVPYHLERVGLADPVREMAARIGDATGLRITCAIADLGDRIPVDAQIGLFRVIQEALNNIVKHAGASDVAIDVTMDESRLRATIRDDGRGFTPGRPAAPAASSRGGFGLFGMSERIRMIGGRLTIDSAQGRGTTIDIELPITPPAARASTT